MLLYHLEFAPFHLIVKLSEKNSKRRLYLDTLKLLAKEEDRKVLSFLTQVHLKSPNVSRSKETATFERIEVSLTQSIPLLQLLAETGRLFYEKRALEIILKPAQIYWEEDDAGYLSARVSKEIAVFDCEHVFPAFAVHKQSLFILDPSVPFRWVELFRKGPAILSPVQMKRFLEESPQVFWRPKEKPAPIQVFPELVLTDATGCFANLWMVYPNIGKILFSDFSKRVAGRERLSLEEKQWEQDLFETGFQKKQVGDSQYYCPGDQVQEALTFLLELGWTLTSSLGKKVVAQTHTNLHITEKHGMVQMDGHFTFQSHLMPLAQLISHQGRWVSLDEEHVGLIDPKKIESFEGTLERPKTALGAIHMAFSKDQVQWQQGLLDLAQGLAEGRGIERAEVGSSFQGKLHSYQQRGVDWLSFLQKGGFGALLADEMGLGKTVQVLAFFSRLRTKLPLLVVAPSSLLYQWRQEIHAFLPGINVYLHEGSKRLSSLADCEGIILTSYAMLRVDTELFSQVRFEVIVLDEANAIKTKSTQTAQSAYRLQGNFKISLSGTPIENSFAELISQFQFLMPELVREDLERFQSQIRPFILRRKKEEVEIELPEKTELITWVEMTEEQRALYDERLKRAKGELLGLEEKPTAPQILEALLRLRQICVDPRIMSEEVEGAKLQLLLEEVQGHKALVYSQFTSYLRLIEEKLLESGRTVYYLDGQMSAEQRASLVTQFQESSEDVVFLLSLKAGGVGLNLTQADYVFLMDPWWNEAVESQAIARAHRIGQKKKVIVKRYLCIGSIEERMLQIKKEKNDLAATLLDQEFSWTSEELFSLLM